jgi:hypothetical protein
LTVRFPEFGVFNRFRIYREAAPARLLKSLPAYVWDLSQIARRADT